MAVGANNISAVTSLLRFRLCSAHARQLATFYEAALGFRRVALEHLSGAAMEPFSRVGGRAVRITLALGEQQIELLQFLDHPGHAYPIDSQTSDLLFQHFAIVVADMEAAMHALAKIPGWSPISVDGPQRLPPSSGGVTAFKFRDPEGHPLELLAFPVENTPAYWQRLAGNSPFLGIDHSAISVSDVARSIAFYESLGLTVSGRSLNDDSAQSRLDHLDQPVVEVIAMSAKTSPPHLELLGYQRGGDRTKLTLRTNDVAATCIVFGVDEQVRKNGVAQLPVRRLLDPDGHHLAIQHVEVPR